MNCQLENINVTQRDGRVTHLDRVYIRGSHVRLFIVPDMLRSVKCIEIWKLGAGELIMLQERSYVSYSRRARQRCGSRKRKGNRESRAWADTGTIS